MKVPVRHRKILVPGYRFAGIACGLKESGKRDIALIVSERPANAVGVFTKNRVKAAPVVLGKKRLSRGVVQAILVNSGNANAYTGRDGVEVARQMTERVGRLLGVSATAVIPSSTGRIGCVMPRETVMAGVDRAVADLSEDGFHRALEGIMTTDAFPKFAVERLAIGGREVTVAGMAKGAGMIAPDMATMLSYILTDAAVTLPALRKALRAALPASFNAIVVDGDMSTNDTALLLANGVAGNRPVVVDSRGYGPFAESVAAVTRALARMIVKDGEGATKLVDIVVDGARSQRDAERVADAIARSPLCKTAFYGGDPYAGRIVCAAGYSGAVFDPGKLDVFLDDVQIVERGEEIVRSVEARAGRVTRRAEFTVRLHLHAGKASARRMASDLTVDYVRFNSDYRT
jgi:glutamate N-acetyltransferase/amino-acid N-acetyltransferase